MVALGYLKQMEETSGKSSADLPSVSTAWFLC